MKRFLLAGALALAITGLLPAAAPIAHAAETAGQTATPRTQIDIERIKSALKLKAEQLAQWAPVEAALRDLARRQAVSDADAGIVRRWSRRVVAVAMDGAAVQRLAVAARPLIQVLDFEQKQAALALAHELGLGPMLAAL